MQLATLTPASTAPAAADPTWDWPLDPQPLRPGPRPAPTAVAQARTTFWWNYGLQRLLDVERGRTLASGFSSIDDAVVAISKLNRRSAGIIAGRDTFDVVELLVPNLVQGAGPWNNKELWRGARPTQLILGGDDALHRSVEALRLLPGSRLAAVVADGRVLRRFERG